MSYVDAMDEVKSKRKLYGGDLVAPNSGFHTALGKYEAELRKDTVAPVRGTSSPIIAKHLAQTRYRLNKLGMPEAVDGLTESDPKVAEIFGNKWDEHAGDRDKICADLHLDPSEWTDGLDRAPFIKKF